LARRPGQSALAATRTVEPCLYREEGHRIERLDILVAAADVAHRGRHAEHDGEQNRQTVRRFAMPSLALSLRGACHGSTS
jgi:hypothetical protein